MLPLPIHERDSWVEWAKRHPRLLLFLSVMFIITWIVEVVTNYVVG